MTRSELYEFYREIAEQYLKVNTERFTEFEKQKFRQALLDYVTSDENFITDEVYDFLANVFAGRPARQDIYSSYLKNKYKNIRFKKICDVGAGRICRLSSALARMGATMYAVDPNIRFSDKEARAHGIKSISKQKFICDEYAPDGNGTDVSAYDLIVGLEPCDATEHIIRQALKYDKPFNVLLCYEAHKALNGTRFRTPEEWFEYLASISKEVKIERERNNFFATNVSEREL